MTELIIKCPEISETNTQPLWHLLVDLSINYLVNFYYMVYLVFIGT